MAKLRVLLMSFRLPDESPGEYRQTYTLSLYHLKAYIQSLPDLKDRVDIEIREEVLRHETWIPAVQDAEYDVIGFSCYVWNFLYTLNLLDRLREMMPQTIFVLGGPVCYMQPAEIDEFFERFSGWDVMVRGEGEIPFSRLLTEFVQGNRTDLDHIASISFKRDDALVHIEPKGEILEAANIPSPFVQQIVPTGYKVFQLQASRGCPFACKFCTMSFIGRKVRNFSMKRVAKELAYANVMGYKEVMSIDASVNLDTERFVQFTELYKKYAKPLTFHMQMEWHLVNQRQVDAMKDIPDVRLNFGIQTLSPGSSWTVGKKNEIEKIIPQMELVRQVTTPMVDLILGLPGDTKEDFIRGFDCVFEHQWEIIVFHCLYPPGTEIYRRRHEFGVVLDEAKNFALVEHATMSKQDIEDCVDYVISRAEDRIERNQWVNLDVLLPGETLSYKNSNVVT